MKSWLLSGPMDHWRVGVKNNTWGVEEGKHAVKSCWEKATPGDLLYFYATDPIKSFVGVGIYVGRAVQRIPLWPEEKSLGKTKYTHRIFFKPLVFVDEGMQLLTISPTDIGVTVSASMNAMSFVGDAELRKRIQLEWRIILPSTNDAALRQIKYMKWKMMILSVARFVLGKWVNISLGI